MFRGQRGMGFLMQRMAMAFKASELFAATLIGVDPLHRRGTVSRTSQPASLSLALTQEAVNGDERGGAFSNGRGGTRRRDHRDVASGGGSGADRVKVAAWFLGDLGINAPT